MANWKAKNVTVDLGYCGHDYDRQEQIIQPNRLTMKNKAKGLI
jgi:hypothetical protein